MRIRRLSDGRIFTSSRALAKLTGISAKKFEDCCKGYWADVEGEKYEYVYYAQDGTEEDSYARSVKGQKKTVPSKYSYYNRRGKASQVRYRKFLLKVSEVIIKWREQQSEEELHTVRAVADFMSEIQPIYFATHDELLSVPDFVFTRHLKAWKEVYEKIVGMRITKIDSERSNRQKHAVVFDLEVDSWATAWDEFPEYFSEAARAGTTEEPYKVPPGPPGRKVIELTQKRIYQSIRHASSVTWIPNDMITFCCNGDLTNVRSLKGTFKFVYAEDYKGSLEAFEEFEWKVPHRRKVSTGAIGVVDKETGEEYNSMLSAEKGTSVPRAQIKKSCEDSKSSEQPRFVYADDFYES